MQWLIIHKIFGACVRLRSQSRFFLLHRYTATHLFFDEGIFIAGFLRSGAEQKCNARKPRAAAGGRSGEDSCPHTKLHVQLCMGIWATVKKPSDAIAFAGVNHSIYLFFVKVLLTLISFPISLIKYYITS